MLEKEKKYIIYIFIIIGIYILYKYILYQLINYYVNMEVIYIYIMLYWI